MPPPKKKKIKFIRNKQGKVVSEGVQQSDAIRRADVEEKTSLAEEKSKRKQRKTIRRDRPTTVKAAVNRALSVLKPSDPEIPKEQNLDKTKTYKQNVLEDKIKYDVRGSAGQKPKVETKKKIKRELAAQAAKKIGTKALLRGIPIVGAIAALLESKPAYNKGGTVYRGRNYANGGRVAKYNKD
tara:strand:- start:719 stop:1267 length:549 start_codon:yes stop_codon:yes gene_type:complete